MLLSYLPACPALPIRAMISLPLSFFANASSPLRSAAASLLLTVTAGSVFAQAPPATFTRVINTAAQSATVNFALHPIRSTNFQVQVQQADGTYVTHVADVPRTYLGTVNGFPGAIAAGLLRADNTLLARISFEDGSTWTTTGATAVDDESPYEPVWPTTVMPAGGAGSTVYAAEVGIDSTFDHFTVCGGTAAAVLEQCEFSVMSTNMVYLRDSALLHRIGRVIVRAVAAQDPYATDGGDTGLLLDRVRPLWQAGIPMGATHDLALVIHSRANGGLAFVGVVGTGSRYSSNDSDSAGDFSLVWRHEAGHNWGANHYEGGGNPEGNTIMSNNGLSRFSSSENRRIIAHRNTKTAILDNLGNYPFPLPPRANQDTASYLRNTPTRVDVIANDSDSNGQVLTLHSFDSTSKLGGTLTRSAGTGPGGRDEVLYTPPPALAAGTDWFAYRIADSTGAQALGHAMLRPRAELLAIADHWKLDETAGTSAVNAIRPSHSGTHENGVLTNQAGANPVTRLGTLYDGANDRTAIPAPGYNTNVLTFSAWVRRNGTQNANSALIFTRAGSSIAGLHFGTANELRYTWNDAGFTFAPAPALTLPDNTWCLAMMAVSPTGVALHLRTPTGLQSAFHATAITAEAFNGTMYFGQDPTSALRSFRGRLDDVRAYRETLTANDIESLYQQATTPPTVALTAPLAGSSISPLNVNFTAAVTTLAHLTDQVDFVENGNVLTTAADFPWQATAPAITPGARSLVARASFGDWGYQVDSAPAAFTAQAPPLPVVRVTASLPASKRGPVAGSFTFTRDHPIGSITLPFTFSGTAVSGTDYTAPGVSSITLPDGTLTASLAINPLAAPPDTTSETVILTLTAGAAYTLGNNTATLTIDDHITSIATGLWTDAATWNSAAAAPITGTQNTGPGYSIAGPHTVTSNNVASNTQALIAGSLRIKNGGVLDLARLHDGGNNNVSYNLPATTMENGGTLQFRASNGSSTHTTSAALTVSGATTLRITGGGYENIGNLTGPLAGSGTLAVSSDTNAGGGPGFVRRISVNSANNSFSGNWTITHPEDGDDFGGLRAGAANALGTGTVTVGTRSQLINDHATGLNSLTAITLTGQSSSLRLNQPWNNPNARLALTGGTPVVQLANLACSIGSLSGTTGIIQGTGTSSALTVNQTIPAAFSGALGANLAFNKSGPATLGLHGSLSPSLRLTLAAGNLNFGSTAPAAVASLTQTGGTLELALTAPAATPLRLSGNLNRTSGTWQITPPATMTTGVPYLIAEYTGTRTGTPPITFQPAVAADIDYGSGSNSRITATFLTPYEVWIRTWPVTGPNAARTADPDNDGLPNELEFAFGFIPNDFNSALTLSLSRNPTGPPTLTINKLIPTGTFTLQWSTTLSQPWENEMVIPNPAAANDYSLPAPGTGPRLFYRLVYTAPAS